MDDPQKIELNIVARADLKQFGDATRGLEGIDKATKNAIDGQKRLQAEFDKTGRMAKSIPYVNPNSTLASSYIPNRKSAAQLQAEERAAGLRTERSMAAEDRQRQVDADRRRKVLEDARRNRFDAGNSFQPSESDDGGPSLLDVVKNIRLKSAAVLAAIGSAAALAAKGIREYTKEEQASASVDASLATRGVLIDKYREKIFALSQAMQDSTGIRRGEFEKAFASLVENGAPLENLDALGKTLENVAGLMKGNVSRAALAMSNALEGNYTSLRRVGFQIPENGTLLEKWAEVVKQSERGAGQLAATNGTLSGEFSKLKNATNDLLGAFGKGIAHATGLSFWLNTASFGAKNLAKAIGGIEAPAVQMNNALKTSSTELEKVREATDDALKKFNEVPAVVDRATQAYDRQKDAARKLLDAQNELADSQLQVDLAKIENNPYLSDAQKISAKAGARMGADQRKFQREQGADQATISAGQRFLNDLGGQLGQGQAEHTDLINQQKRLEAAHAARAEAANADEQVAKSKQALAKLDEADAISDASEPGVAKRARMLGTQSDRTAAEKAIKDAEAAAAAAHVKAAGFGSGLTDSKLTETNNRLAELEKAIDELTKKIREKTPGVQDEISAAQLRMNTRASVFPNQQSVQRMETQTALRGAINQAFPSATDPNRNRAAALDTLGQALAADPNMTPQQALSILRSVGATPAEVQHAAGTLPSVPPLARGAPRRQGAYPPGQGPGTPTISGSDGAETTHGEDGSGMHPRLGNAAQDQQPTGIHISGDIDSGRPSDGLHIRLGNGGGQEGGRLSISGGDAVREEYESLFQRMKQQEALRDAAVMRGLAEIVKQRDEAIKNLEAQMRTLSTRR